MLPLVLFVVAFEGVSPQTAQAPRDAPSATAARAAISGRITEKDSGRPFARAIVSLRGKGADTPRQTLADADGRYAFSDLEAGAYALWATPGELIATHLEQAYGERSPLVGMPPPVRIDVKPGDVLTGLDIALPRALAIEGRILDPWDDPIAEAEVTVVRPDRTPAFVWPVYSDDRGEYRVYGLAPGRYRVCAAPGGSFPSFSDSGSKAVRTCHLAAVSESDATDVLLDDADATGIDIRMQRTGTYSASGSVLDAGGVAVEDADVSAARDDHQNGAQSKSHDGQFTLTGLTPGRYRVQASIGGRTTPDDPRPPAREREWGYTTMEVDSGDVSNVVVTVAKPQRVSGRVVFEGPRPSGSLHMMVQMGSAPDMWDLFSGRSPSGAVDDRLTFEVGELYRAPLVVHVEGLPEGWLVRAVRYDGRDITDQPVDFGAPSTDRRLEIRLTDRVARPHVRVTDGEGRSAAAFHVVVIPADPARSSAIRLGTSRGFSNESVIALDAMLPGEYLMAALPPDDAMALFRDHERVEGFRASARRVTIAEGHDQVIDLPLSRLPRARQ